MDSFELRSNKGVSIYCNDDGDLHREDGPAVKYDDGRKLWYLNGKEYTKGTWLIELAYRKTTKNEIITIPDNILQIILRCR